MITNIENCTLVDTEIILDLYTKARERQKEYNAVLWPEFQQSLVEQEICENRQWKIVENGDIACVWAITFSDPEIWEEKNNEPSVYIHRIATNPAYRGKNYVQQIVSWAKDFAKQLGKKFIRMDTVGNNTKLIEYYQSNGFLFLGMVELKNTAGLPEHYTKDQTALFEINIDKSGN